MTERNVFVKFVYKCEKLSCETLLLPDKYFTSTRTSISKDYIQVGYVFYKSYQCTLGVAIKC